MQFNSIGFLFCFLPAFMVVYRFAPNRIRPWVSVAGSIAFYALSCSGDPLCLTALLCTAVLAWGCSFLLEKHRKGWLLGAVLGVLGATLTFFKIFWGGKLLPVGMSFYLFQVAACLIDVYRGKIGTEKNPVRFFAEILMFPKLLSGPLMDPADLRQQAQCPEVSNDNLYHGLEKLILGLAMKVVLANRLGGLWGQASAVGYESISTAFAWMAILAFTMQLFLDFQGYSLMAIGLGQMMGFRIPLNFLDPYASKTVSEFYRRWHATLGAWFREYLYFPLGGSRKGTLRTVLNLLFVWLVTGFWHGVGGNYLVWAGILCLLIIGEHLWIGKFLKRTKVLGHIYTVFFIVLSWVPFAIGDWGRMVTFMGRLFGLCGQALNARDFILWGSDYLPILLAGALCMTPLPEKLCKKLSGTVMGDLLLLGLFWLAVYGISTAAQDPFLYYQY